jgi:hypothetical protein
MMGGNHIEYHLPPRIPAWRFIFRMKLAMDPAALTGVEVIARRPPIWLTMTAKTVEIRRLAMVDQARLFIWGAKANRCNVAVRSPT